MHDPIPPHTRDEVITIYMLTYDQMCKEHAADNMKNPAVFAHRSYNICKWVAAHLEIRRDALAQNFIGLSEIFRQAALTSQGKELVKWEFAGNY